MFEYPFVFLALILFFVPFLKPKNDSLIFSLAYFQTQKRSHLVSILKFLALLFFLMALASPISKKDFLPKKDLSHAIILGLDISGSMAYRLQRDPKIDIAKQMAAEFVKKRQNDHIGVVAFADFAYVAVPLTYDNDAVFELISRMYIGAAGQNYTTIRDGLFLALRILSKTQAKEKIIVLLTDGEDNHSSIPIATLSDLIKKNNIKIYTIGIDHPSYYNERELLYYANISGGKFFQALDAMSLKKIYDEIDKLERSLLESKKITQYHYYFQYPLFVSLICFMLFLLLKRKFS